MVRSIALFLLKFEFFISNKNTKIAAESIVMNMENPAQFIFYYADKLGWGKFLY
jgi:hypothetical protein